LVHSFYDENFIQTASHPPYSPGFAGSDSWLCAPVKRQLIGQSFDTREELFGPVQRNWNDFNLAMLQSVFGDWMAR
jgi:hypothetical protein